MRTLRFEFEILLDDLPAEERADLERLSGAEEGELGSAADIDIKELGGNIACTLAWAEKDKIAEFWSGSDMFGTFAEDGGVKLVGARDLGAIAADPRSAWGTLQASRDVLASLKSLREAMLHGNGAAAWQNMAERADRAIAELEALTPKVPIEELPKKKLCQHRDTGRGVCADCGEFL